MVSRKVVLIILALGKFSIRAADDIIDVGFPVDIPNENYEGLPDHGLTGEHMADELVSAPVDENLDVSIIPDKDTLEEIIPNSPTDIIEDTIVLEAPIDEDIVPHTSNEEVKPEDVIELRSMYPKELNEGDYSNENAPRKQAVPECQSDEFSIPELNIFEDAACHFAFFGYFAEGAALLNKADVTAVLKQLYLLDQGGLSTATHQLQLVKKCFKYFQPPSYEKLTENAGGVSGEVLQMTRGYNIDLMDPNSTCPKVMASLMHLRTGGVSAPESVIKLCFKYFNNEVIAKLMKNPLHL